MNTQRTTYFTLCILICLSSFICAQPCPYDFGANRDPIIPGTVLAENKISSYGKVHSPDTVNFSAGKEICLEPSFEVYAGGVFEAYIEGCEPICKESNVCAPAICKVSYDLSSTANGDTYFTHDALFMFPDTFVLQIEQGNIIKIINPAQNSIVAIDLDTLFESIYNLPLGSTNGVSEKCLCNKPFLKYTNDDIIFDEDGVKLVSGPAGASGEGGVCQLNYTVDPDFKPQNNLLPSIATHLNFNFRESAVIPDNIVVAILDSGLEPSLLLPGENVLYNKNKYPCQKFMSSPAFGWNFISDNNNLFDDRGHGSLVTLNYVKAIQNLNSINQNDIKVLTVKVLDKCGMGTSYTTACGLYYAQGVGVDIINASWGMYKNTKILQRAINEVSSSGIKIICSAGNNSADLTSVEHFPSGYANPFVRLKLNGDPGPKVSGLSNVFEVAGSCDKLLSACANMTENLPLWTHSNYYSQSFVEPAIGAETLLPPGLISPVLCQINGTSFAAPIFAAGMSRQMNLGGSTNKAKMIGNSKKIHADKNYFSYFINNCF